MVPDKAAVLNWDTWKVAVDEAKQVNWPAVYVTELVPILLSEGVCTPRFETPEFKDQTPPLGFANKVTDWELLHKAAIGLIVGVGGLNTDTDKTVDEGHTLGLGVERVV